MGEGSITIICEELDIKATARVAMVSKKEDETYFGNSYNSFALDLRRDKGLNPDLTNEAYIKFYDTVRTLCRDIDGHPNFRQNNTVKAIINISEQDRLYNDIPSIYDTLYIEDCRSLNLSLDKRLEYNGDIILEIIGETQQLLSDEEKIRRNLNKLDLGE
jgi:hypothetical protein